MVALGEDEFGMRKLFSPLSYAGGEEALIVKSMPNERWARWMRSARVDARNEHEAVEVVET